MAKASKKKNSLTYVREQRKLSKAAVATELNTSVGRVTAWETGERAPTERQYQILQGIYGVPDYLLAGEATPNLQPLPEDFRKEKAETLETSPKGLRAYFARSEAGSTFALIANAMSEQASVKLPKLTDYKELPSVSGAVSSLLKIEPDDVDLIGSPDLALRKFRYLIELSGLFTFMVDVPQQDYRGLFVSLDEKWGLSLINKRTFKEKARLFTLFHELGHYLTSTPGVSDPFVIRNELEECCNKFASHSLAPPALFHVLKRDAFARYNSLSDRVRFISRNCLLSYGATTYRLFKDDEISRRELNDWYTLNHVARDYGGEDVPDEDDDTSSGGNYAYNVISDYGYRSLQILQEALVDGKVDEVDVGRLTNARGKTQAQMFETLDKRIEEFGI